MHWLNILNSRLEFEGKVVFPEKCIPGRAEKCLRLFSKLDVIKVSFETDDYENIIVVLLHVVYFQATRYPPFSVPSVSAFAPLPFSLFFSVVGILNGSEKT